MHKHPQLQTQSSYPIQSCLCPQALEPTNARSVKNGELTFGGVDPTNFRVTGPLTYM